jgi:apolipoprotein N-acyltransferase
MSWRQSPWFGATAAVLSGALLLASRDIGPIGPLALIAPVPLLIYALSAPRWWSVAAAAFAARLIGALGVVWAYHDVLPPPALAIWVVGQAAGFTLIILATRWIARGAPAWMALLSFPLLASASEFLFGLVSPHGSFGAVGYALVDVPPLLQLASVGGLAALGFCAALFSMTLALAITQPCEWRTLALLGATPIVLAAVFGLWRMNQPYESHTRIALVAIDSLTMRAFDGGAADVADAYAREVQALAPERPDIVVLPEKVFADVSAPLQVAATALDARVVAGFDETLPDGRRVNSARVFAPNDAPLLYIKRQLIPGLELGYAIGDGPLILGARGVAICKDMDFAPLIRGYGQRGVQLMLVPAWDFVADGRMHARMAVVRAVENGFALARAAAQGRLTLADSTGRTVAEATTSPQSPTRLVADLGLRSGGTLYARFGDVFAWIMVAGAALLLGARLRRAA